MGLWLIACWDCGLESRRGNESLSHVSVVCCKVNVLASGRSLVQRSPTECGGPENENEAWIMRRPWPTRGYCTMGKSGCHEYIRTGMVQMNWLLSLCDHRRFTELVHHVGLS